MSVVHSAGLTVDQKVARSVASLVAPMADWTAEKKADLLALKMAVQRAAQMADPKGDWKVATKVDLTARCSVEQKAQQMVENSVVALVGL